MKMLNLALSLRVLAIESGASTAIAERVFRSVLVKSRIDDGFAAWRLDFAAAGIAMVRSS